MPKLSRCKKLGSNIIDARGHFAEARHRREAARFREFAALARQIPLDVLKSSLGGPFRDVFIRAKFQAHGQTGSF
jgi:hypothetical protein